MRAMRRLWLVLIVALVGLLAACAPRLAALAVPTYQVESGRLASINLPGGGQPAAAVLELQLRVQNPNAVAVRLANAAGDVFLDGQNVGRVDLPNIDLPARGEARQLARLTLPITFGNLAEFLRLGRGEALGLRVDGSFTVDAGLLGRPTFGPFTLFQKSLQVARVLP